jgi:hypothetical protein
MSTGTTQPWPGEVGDLSADALLADEAIGEATKDQLADVARLLALNIGDYHEKYGDVPQETLTRMVRADTLDKDTKRPVLHGIQNRVLAPAELRGDGVEDEGVH